MQLRAKARRWRADQSLFPKGTKRRGLIILDYLQLVSGSGRQKDGNREQEISEISRGLKSMAKDLGVPVIALSQLNREVENRTNKRPLLSDLRESGAIEQDADAVCFLYRDEYYHPASVDRGVAEVIVAKQRHGPTDTVRLAWLDEFTRFENLSERREQEA
jgi:replicative DNA helicase